MEVKYELITLNTEMCRLCPSDTILFDLYLPVNLEIRHILNLFVNVEVRSSSKNKKFSSSNFSNFLGENFNSTSKVYL